MDFCTIHFGKSLNDLTTIEIENYFLEERTETDQLEFKSINSVGNIVEKFTGIQRTVCALLNSIGGLIIWGAPEGLKIEERKEKIFKGELTYFDTILQKDYVISKISDSIIPLPRNIRVKILIEGNSSFVIIEVDSSEYSPHQTSDKYYMRIDGQTKPAPHHYIEALFKKITYPNIEVYLKVTKVEVYQGSKYKVNFDMYFVNWSPLQNEERLSFRVLTDGVFGQSQNPQQNHRYRMRGHEYFEENAKEIFFFGEPIREAEVILFDPNKLSQKGNKTRLLITFGGKFSPRKTSEYDFDLSNIYLKNPNDIVVFKNENKLTKDVQDEKGVTKEAIIKSFMEL